MDSRVPFDGNFKMVQEKESEDAKVLVQSNSKNGRNLDNLLIVGHCPLIKRFLILSVLNSKRSIC